VESSSYLPAIFVTIKLIRTFTDLQIESIMLKYKGVITLHKGMLKMVTGICRCCKLDQIFKVFRDYLLNSGIDEGYVPWIGGVCY
jgi:uncharacterized membrane-anchored protein